MENKYVLWGIYDEDTLFSLADKIEDVKRERNSQENMEEF